MVVMRELPSGRVLKTFKAHVGRFHAVAVSPDGHLIAAPDDSRVKIFDARDGALVATLESHWAAVVSIAFSADGRRVISGSQDGTVKVWAAANGETLATFIAAKDEWLVMTREGFFDASPEGARLLHVVRGFEAYSIDQFYEALHRPDLVREKLAGDPQGRVREAAAKLDLTKGAASGAPRR
jgi:hypothetical protein